MSRNYKIHDPNGLYFLTFATVAWVDVFTRPIYRDLFLESIRYCQKEKGFTLYCWCVMSNHVHFIASSTIGDLSGTLRDLKKFTSKRIFEAIKTEKESRRDWMFQIFKKAGAENSNNKNFQVWQQDNHPIELYSNPVMDQKLEYIHQNPVKAGIVEYAEDYVYSSARDYAGIKGLLDIEFLE